jgi:hypothetical protein
MVIIPDGRWCVRPPERRRRAAVLVFALLAALLVLLPWRPQLPAHDGSCPSSTFWYASAG